MFSFLKQWSDNASEYQALQNELINIFKRQGINFMHLHPQITKCAVIMARRDGAENSVKALNELMEQILSKGLSPNDASAALIEACKSRNDLFKWYPHASNMTQLDNSETLECKNIIEAAELVGSLLISSWENDSLKKESIEGFGSDLIQMIGELSYLMSLKENDVPSVSTEYLFRGYIDTFGQEFMFLVIKIFTSNKLQNKLNLPSSLFEIAEDVEDYGSDLIEVIHQAVNDAIGEIERVVIVN